MSPLISVHVSEEDAKRLAAGEDITISAKAKKEEWPEIGGVYYCVNNRGAVDFSSWANDKIDQGRMAIDNVFRTEEEAEAKAEYMRAIATVTLFIKERNGDWVPDWSDDNQSKCLPCFSGYNEKWVSEKWSTDQYQIAFPYAASREIIDSLISNHEKELNIIRDYKF